MGWRNYGCFALLWSTASVLAAGLPSWYPVSQGVVPFPRYRALMAIDTWRNSVAQYCGWNASGA